jgi:predicted TIM-barrel fold metal-dependent hydrolase
MKVLLILSFISFAIFAAERPLLLDAHLHYFPEDDGFVKRPPKLEPVYAEVDGLKYCSMNCGETIDQISYKEIMDKDQFKTSFLISPSFDITHGFSTVIPEWRRDLKYVSIMDKRVSSLIQKEPDKYIGLCGYNSLWKPDFSLKMVSECLKLPGMKGLKVHSHVGAISSKKSQQNLKDILDQNFKKGPGVILWHLIEEEELDYLLSILREYPNTKFIIAHSMYDPKMVERVLEKEKKEGRFNNLYLETSATKPEKMKESWVAFGMDRILYGSDNFIESYDKQISKGVFSNEELDQILNINSQKMLTYLGHPGINDSDRSISKESKPSIDPTKKRTQAVQE